ncbi:hypothetical protein QE152_g41333, partial [Popillia japonica]
MIEKEMKTEAIENLDEKDKKEFLAKDAKAKSIIVQCITDKHIDYIKDAKTAYNMIAKLNTCSKVECLLDEKGVKDMIEKEMKTEAIENLDEKDKKEFLAKDAKAKSIIVQCITDKH